MTVIWILLTAVVGYLLGSINTSIVVGKLVYKTDIREHGSGNAGATNALRTFGKKAAILAVVGDALKGIVACIIGRLLVGGDFGGDAPVYVGEYIGGMMAVIGHNWPIYFGFKGGKGVMTSFAVILFISPVSALLSMLLFVVLVSIWRMVSLGSIAGAVAFPVIAALFHEPLMLVLVGLFLGLLIVVRHIPNIKRILNGTEKKLGRKEPARDRS